jgi:hypothetical protein
MLDGGTDRSVVWCNAAGAVQRSGMGFGGLMGANASNHPAAELTLPERARRAVAHLATVDEPAFLQPDSQQHNLGLSARHPRRQQRESGRYGSLPYFREGHE